MNTNLIAAAPDLLDAAQRAEKAFTEIENVLVMALERGATRFEIVDMRTALREHTCRVHLQEAIAKAEGR